MTLAMKALAGGDVDVVIPSEDRNDEMGDMARAVQVFKESMSRANTHAKEQKNFVDTLQKAKDDAEKVSRELSTSQQQMRTLVDCIQAAIFMKDRSRHQIIHLYIWGLERVQQGVHGALTKNLFQQFSIPYRSLMRHHRRSLSSWCERIHPLADRSRPRCAANAANPLTRLLSRSAQLLTGSSADPIPHLTEPNCHSL